MFISVRNSHATLHHWGETDRKTEIGTDAVAVEEHYLLAWQLPKDSLAAILTPLSLAAHRGTTHNRLGLSLPTINLNYASKGDLVVTFSQLKSPPPVISLCQVAIKCAIIFTMLFHYMCVILVNTFLFDCSSKELIGQEWHKDMSSGLWIAGFQSKGKQVFSLESFFNRES